MAPKPEPDPIHPALLQCREDRTPLTFTSGDPASLMHGTIDRILEHHILVTLAGLDHGAKPVEGHVVCCNFSHGARSGAFFARLNKWTEHDDKLQMALEHPKEVLYCDVRRAFRIPTKNIRWIAATIQGDGAEVLGQVLDISRVGLGVAADGTSFQRGQEVRILVTTDQSPIVMPAKVAVAKAQFVGLALEDAPNPWLDLVSRLERDWMRRNRG